MTTIDNDNNLDDSRITPRSKFKTGVTMDELKLGMSDDKLIGLIKNWLAVAAQSQGILTTEGDINKAYYKGKDNRIGDIMDDKSKVTDNRIFTDMETIIPGVTSTPAKPIVFIPSAEGDNKQKKDAIRDQAIKNQKVLMAIYDDQKLQQKYEKMYRQHQIYRIGMVKYGMSDDEIFAEVILPPRLLLDSEAISMEDSEFIGEKIVDTAKNIIKKFPDKEKEISSEVQGKLGTKITYIEWWTDEFVVYSIDSKIILESKKNPLFDYKGIPKVSYDKNGLEIKGEPTLNNFFVRPKKPYILFNVYNIGESLIDDTTTLILSKSLQDGVNDTKRQIADNKDVAGNPIRVYNGFTKEQADEANDNLRAGDGVNLTDEQSITYVQAAPLPAFVSNDGQDSRNAIDNIFGIHDTSKGVRDGGAGESGVAREQLREGDQDRQATIGRAIEQVSEELYKGFAHLVKVFYDKEQVLPVLGKEGAEEYVNFKRDDIAEGMKIRVKPGSSIPDDPNSLKAQGLELAGMNRITNRRLYEMLGMEDADEAVKDFELEAVKAQKEQEKVLAKEQEGVANKETTKGIESQIENLQ